jgi:tryptophan 2,3-dioxygenase
MPLNYASYLEIEHLLSLQRPKSDPVEHDEMLFIVIHQVYELWFKQVLHEIDKVKADFSANRVFEAITTFKRVNSILKTLVGQLDILETMTPLSFSAFRDRLDTASGFQSMQFRELEFVLGYKREEVLQYIDKSWTGFDRVMRRLDESSLIDHFYEFLEQREVEIPKQLRARGPREPAIADATVQDGLVRLYIDCPEVAILLELMTDFDEGMQEWRYRHVKLVERTIGGKHGTGGSPGVDFLKKSLFQPIFADLWAIRHRF